MSFHRIKPILFNTEMVRAILEGRKTVTRRLPGKRIEDKWYEYDEYVSAVMPHDIPCVRCNEKEFYEQYPPYQIGDILYVRETWARLVTAKDGEMQSERYVYKATDTYPFGESGYIVKFQWKPSIHMPKEAARIWLKVTDVRIERLQDITPKDAFNEGTGKLFLEDIAYGDKNYECDIDDEYGVSLEQFAWLWESTLRKTDLPRYGWDANPWVWVIEFERIER